MIKSFLLALANYEMVIFIKSANIKIKIFQSLYLPSENIRVIYFSTMVIYFLQIAVIIYL